MKRLFIFFMGILFSLSANAVWVDFLDPREISDDGLWIGQISECRAAKNGGFTTMVNRTRERLRAASSDLVGKRWKVDENTFRKAWAVFEKGLSIGQEQARQMARSRAYYERKVCSGMYQDIYEMTTEKSLPEGMMDGSVFNN